MASAIGDIFALNRKHSNLDAYYGPYTTEEEASVMVPENIRDLGLTVGIKLFFKSDDGDYIYEELTDPFTGTTYHAFTYNNTPQEGVDRYTFSELEEYQWKKNTYQLERKILGDTLNLAFLGASTNLTVNIENPIVIPIKITGRNTIKELLIFNVQNNVEYLYLTITSVAKNTIYSLNINYPSTVGNYVFRIRVLDKNDEYSKVENSSNNYIEIHVKYGVILATLDLTDINNSVKVKNANNLLGKTFKGTFYTIAGVSILNIYLYNEEVGELLLTDASTDYSKLVTFTLTDISQFSGHEVKLLIEYKDESNNSLYIYSNVLFTVLDINSITFLNLSAISQVVENTPIIFTIRAETGNGPTAIQIVSTENSDFTYSGVINSYTDTNIYITHKPVEVSKTGAVFEFNYSFIVDGTQKTGTKSFNMDKVTVIKKGTLNFYDILDDASAYKRNNIILDEPIISDGSLSYYLKNGDLTIENCNGSSFVLDLYCKLNRSDLSTKYLTIYGDQNILVLIDDIISILRSGNLNLFTPTNEWVLIGIGFLIKELSTFVPNDNVIYNAIYINGVLCKNIRIKGALTLFTTLKLSFKNMLIQNGFIYYSKVQGALINPNTNEGKTIIYNNYISHSNNSFTEPTLPKITLTPITVTDIPSDVVNFLIGKYNIDDTSSYLNDIPISRDPVKDEYSKNILDDFYKEFGIERVNFGTISDGLNKAENETLYRTNTFNTLFNLKTILKSALLKKYGVLCKINIDGIEQSDVFAEVHTQGTSTLNYSIPNFKFTFKYIKRDSSNNIIIITDPETEDLNLSIKKKKIKIIEDYEESTLTAKADYMDSSHLNNTPTCIYYNNLILKLKQANIEVSPAALNDKLDAIWGNAVTIDIVTQIADQTHIDKLGSFMLNIDKTGDALGFSVNNNKIDPDNDDLPYCLSFEGTSNDASSGHSARFIFDLTEMRKNEPDFTLDYIENVDTLTEHNDLTKKWCRFLSKGLEYRYPDKDIYKEGKNKYMPISHFKALYKLWSWVSKSNDPNYDGNYKEEFQQHFDLYYCMLYYIDLIVFGLTDNLGKNCMFDTWDGIKWYPRPYDLDSLLGLNNNGEDMVPTFVEIKKLYSLDYDKTKPDDIISVIPFEGTNRSRYQYSSADSVLWSKFYDNFKDEIDNFYKMLRNPNNNFDFNPESIISNAENVVISKLGINLYNEDFKNKYLGSAEQEFAFGNRWSKYKKWITDRFAFCDSYFNNVTSHNIFLSGTIGFNVTMKSPQYVRMKYLANSAPNIYFVLSKSDNFVTGASDGGATLAIISLNDSQLISTNLFEKVGKVSIPFGENNLQKLDNFTDLSTSYNETITDLTNVININNAPILSNIDVSYSSISSLTISTSVKKVNASNCKNLNLTVSANGLLEELNLLNSTFNSSLQLSTLPNLRILNLEGCKLLGISLDNLPNLTEILIDENTSFGGTFYLKERVGLTKLDLSNLKVNLLLITSSSLEILDCRGTLFTEPIFDISTLGNILQLLFNDSIGLKKLAYIESENNIFSFSNLKYFGISGSEINALGQEDNVFDCTKLNKYLYNDTLEYKAPLLQPINKARNKNDSGVGINTVWSESNQRYELINKNTGEELFSFINTNIITIKNLEWNFLSGNNLFAENLLLLNILNSNIVINSGDANRLFFKCKQLSNLGNLSNNDKTVIAINVTSATEAFAMCNNLLYSIIENIVETSNIEDFTSFLKCKEFNDGDTIDLSKYQHAKKMDYTFTAATFGSVGYDGAPNSSNTLKIKNSFPISITSLTYTFRSRPNLNFLVDSTDYFDNLIKNCTNLTTAVGMFSTCSNLSKNIKSDFFPKGILDISEMFGETNVGFTVSEGNNFQFPSSLQKAVTTFCRSKGFSQDTNVNDVFKKCNNLLDISGCFCGVNRVYADSFSLGSNATVNVTGLFGLTSSTNYNEDAFKNVDGFSFIDGTPIINSSFYRPSVGTYTYGFFEKRWVPNTTFTNNVQGNSLRNVFKDSKTHFIEDLQISKRDCYGLFYGAKNYDVDDSTQKYITIDITNCDDLRYSFYNSVILKDLINLSPGVKYCNYMYAGTNFSTGFWNKSLPADYFQNCKETLIEVLHMFESNPQLEQLDYNDNVGLFDGCTKLSLIDYMFNGANRLHGGIPNNIFGNSEIKGVKSLNYMFARTLILYGVETIKKCIDLSTLAPLSNLQSINYMFYRHRLHSTSSLNLPITYTITEEGKSKNTIDAATFNKDSILEATHLFSEASGIPDVQFSFTSNIKNLSYAFYDTLILAEYNIEINNSFISNSKIESIIGMFGISNGQDEDNNGNIKKFIDALLTVLLELPNRIINMLGAIYNRYTLYDVYSSNPILYSSGYTDPYYSGTIYVN